MNFATSLEFGGKYHRNSNAFDPSGAEASIVCMNAVNTMVFEGPAPCIARTLATMVLTMYIVSSLSWSLSSMRNDFKLLY